MFQNGRPGGCTLNSTSLFPPFPGCNPPSLPESILNPITFTTDTGLVAACGGTTTTCLVLKNGVWQPDPRVPDLPWPARLLPTAVSVPGGVLVMGGQPDGSRQSRFNQQSSVLLRWGSSWEEGPRLLGKGAQHACSVSFGESVFLIGGATEERQVRELNTRTWEWEEKDMWPQL